MLGAQVEPLTMKLWEQVIDLRLRVSEDLGEPNLFHVGEVNFGDNSSYEITHGELLG